MEFGLSRITRLIRDRYPVLPWKAIHIAGTNGKGSTGRYLEALLRNSNIHVGLFSSPQLRRESDTVRVNERAIHEDLFQLSKKIVQDQNDQSGIQATRFELLTATAFEAFTRSKVDLAIIECGLGGLLDATNVLLPQEVLCSVITKIGLDHQEILGDTIEKVAEQKAGIIKPSVPVVVDCTNDPGVLKVIESAANRAGSKMQTSFSSFSDDFMVHNMNVASSALAVVRRYCFDHPDALKKEIFVMPRYRQMATMQHAASHFPGRFQTLPAKDLTGEGGSLILDGAHNPQAAQALRAKLDLQQPSPKPITWVIGMSSTKDAAGFFKALLRPGDKVILCPFDPPASMPWVKSMPPRKLREHINGNEYDFASASSARRALTEAAKTSSKNPTIVVTGSLYLIGEILNIRHRVEAKKDPIINNGERSIVSSSLQPPVINKGTKRPAGMEYKTIKRPQMFHQRRTVDRKTDQR